MPIPTSQRQFRFLQEVAHRVGRAKKRGMRRKTTLSAASAQAGLDEFEARGGSYKSLPARKGKP